MSHVSTQLAATKLPVASEKRTRSRSIPNFVLPLQFSEQKRTADRRSRGFIQISFGWPPLSPSFPLTSRVCPLCLHIPSSGPAVLLSFTFNSERNLWVERINSRFAAQESTIVPAVLGLVVAWSRSELVLPDFLQSCPLQIEDAAPIRPSSTIDNCTQPLDSYSQDSSLPSRSRPLGVAVGPFTAQLQSGI
jgi:hypothetical protein